MTRRKRTTAARESADATTAPTGGAPTPAPAGGGSGVGAAPPPGPEGLAPESMPELPPELSELAADFEMQGEIGRGGTAVVYRAYDRTLQRTVAIKVIRARFVGDDELVARLEREARLVARLDHPNLVSLYSVRRLRHGSLALIMRLVEGGTLRDLMAAQGAMSVRQVTRVLADTARALSAAHGRGVVHRDVKPENIYVEESTGRALLADFGAAAPLGGDARLTVAGMTIGTPGYLAPELIDGGEATARSDLYGLGLVGWEMLAGRPPWGGQTLFEILAFRKHSELPAIETLRDDVPGTLAEALAGALAREPSLRWESVDEFLMTMLSPGGVGVRRARRHASRDVALPPAIGSGDVVATTVRFRRDALEPVDPAAAAAGVGGGLGIAPEGLDRDFAPLARATPVLIPPDDAAREAAEDDDDFDDVPPVRDGAGWRRRAAVLGGASALLAGAALLYAFGIRSDERPRDLASTVAGGDAAPTMEVPVAPPSAPVTLPPAVATPPAGAAAPAPADSARGIPPVTTAAAEPDAPLLPPAPPAQREAAAPAPRVAVAPPVSAPPSAPSPSPSRAPRSTGAGAPATVTPSAPERTEPVRPVPSRAGTEDDAPAPRGAATFSAVRTMAVGGQHSCAVTRAGDLWCWGSNGRRQLGATTAATRAARPTVVQVAADVRAVELGLSHSCAIANGGEALCWGSNGDGQLGDGSSASSEGPVRVAGGIRFVELSLGVAHSCGLDGRGAAHCWGSNEYGQLGTGRAGHRPSPAPVAGGRRFSTIASGWHHSCAVESDGRLVCWGANRFGQVGDGSTTSRAAPVPINSSARFTRVVAGGQHSCGLTTAGTVTCWGRNHAGQLGDGTRADSRTPRVVDVGASVIKVAAGSVHTCALARGGDVYCWGQNSYGQLGDGTTEDRAAPVSVAGAPPFVDLVAAGGHTCGLTAGGQLHCWGYNLDGQLGDGTRVNRARPTLVRAER